MTYRVPRAPAAGRRLVDDAACPTGCGRARLYRTYAVCPSCWVKVPDHIRQEFTDAQHARRRTPDDPLAIHRFDVARDAVIASIPKPQTPSRTRRRS
jgi:hypothetical protein